MKYVYLNPDNTVREILPELDGSIEEWYNADFAARCAGAPDEVEPNWEYDPETDIWYKPGERPAIVRKSAVVQAICNALESI